MTGGAPGQADGGDGSTGLGASTASSRAGSDGAAGSGPAGAATTDPLTVRTLSDDPAGRPGSSPGEAGAGSPRAAASARTDGVPTTGSGSGAAAQAASARAAGSAPATSRVVDAGAPVAPKDLPAALPRALRLAAREGAREARIRPWPPELGAIQVDLRLEGNRVSAQLRSERADVRLLLEGLRGELDRGLRESGLLLQRLDVGSVDAVRGGSPGDGRAAAGPALPDAAGSVTTTGSGLAGSGGESAGAGDRGGQGAGAHGRGNGPAAARADAVGAIPEGETPRSARAATVTNVDAWA
jgi:flagellar hook-length control protein FliK